MTVLSVLAENLPTFTVDTNTVRSWTQFAVEIAAVVALLAAVRRRADKAAQVKQDAQEARILAALETRTQPIQPLYRNNGESLADIANEGKRLGSVLAEQGRLLGQVHDVVRNLSSEIALHRVATASEFEVMKAERARILTVAEANVAVTSAALAKHGIDVAYTPMAGAPVDPEHPTA